MPHIPLRDVTLARGCGHTPDQHRHLDGLEADLRAARRDAAQLRAALDKLCGHELHGADGGPCPRCGWDAAPIPTEPAPPIDLGLPSLPAGDVVAWETGQPSTGAA